ncbi:MAG: NFACT family protein [Fretibacterium sp.]|nr:NFACT family protein [Fretibacterium sp.]
MAFGPEFIHGLEAELKARLPWRVSRVEGGESWVALKVSARQPGSRSPEGRAASGGSAVPPQDAGRLAEAQDHWLLLSWGAGSAGCCLAGSDEVAALKEGAPARMPLAEALKSRAVRGDITAVRQLAHDRVLEFNLNRRVAAGTSIGYFLVLEATEPTGNLLLLDGGHKIEEAARHSAPDQNRYRTLLPGHPYVLPPAFKGPLPGESPFLRFEDVPNLMGIGRPLARLIQSHWEERDPDTWLAALSGAAAGDVPLLCQRTAKGYLTRLNYPLPEAEPLGKDALAAAARGVLVPLLQRGRDRQLHEISARLKRTAKARERHRDGLLKQLKDCEAADVFRQKGEAILAHLTEIPPRAEEAVLTDWMGNTLTIALDPRLSPSHNAERYFKKYRKAKGDPQKIKEEIAALEGAINEILEQRDLLESIGSLRNFEQAVKDLEEWLSPEEGHGTGTKRRGKGAKEKDAPPHLVFMREGLTILVGLSARGNRYVTFRQARGEDIWLHAHELPGAHVIIRGARDRQELEEEHRAVLEFAASLAAGHSKGRNSGSVPVDYTERRYVRPVPGTVALVTYTNPGTLRVAPQTEEEGR